VVQNTWGLWVHSRIGQTPRNKKFRLDVHYLWNLTTINYQCSQTFTLTTRSFHGLSPEILISVFNHSELLITVKRQPEIHLDDFPPFFTFLIRRLLSQMLVDAQGLWEDFRRGYKDRYQAPWFLGPSSKNQKIDKTVTMLRIGIIVSAKNLACILTPSRGPSRPTYWARIQCTSCTPLS